MKGQISFVEYLVSMVVFIVFVSYIFLSISDFIPSYLNEIKKERMKSEVYQVSELLINDPGEPKNWNAVGDGQIKRIGLSDENSDKTNFLSASKVNALRTKCANYDSVRDWLGVENQFSLLIVDKTGSVEAVDCHPTTYVTRGLNVSIRRTVAFSNMGYGELVLQMW